jgi:hypothetical protein
VEGSHQIDCGLSQTQMVQCGPRVDYVALRTARLIEALEHILIEIDTEGAATSVGAVDRTGTSPLWAGAALRDAEMLQYPCDRQLPLQVLEVNESAVVDGIAVG